ncbi:Uncharacterized protein dnm_027210 [Desulfonema magnum]|uniref:Uncharacterized protein n=1 Tax=Desulfonema magnum TaxID=45655 RepID=A0A975GMD7_9BACT|nr:Uncharacterized protein dnm_027210 [Desulfonema magnum]
MFHLMFKFFLLTEFIVFFNPDFHKVNSSDSFYNLLFLQNL